MNDRIAITYVRTFPYEKGAVEAILRNSSLLSRYVLENHGGGGSAYLSVREDRWNKLTEEGRRDVLKKLLPYSAKPPFANDCYRTLMQEDFPNTAWVDGSRLNENGGYVPRKAA